MSWIEIKTSLDNTHFIVNGVPVFGKKFIEVLKFHAPGLAPVRDESGAYHINNEGKELYGNRYSRTFGYYNNRAAVVEDKKWYHIDEFGIKAYSENYSWVGNFQENYCTVRDQYNQYYHIDINGEAIYDQRYLYCGDFKDGYACVKNTNGLYKHINIKGESLNDKEFHDLGVYHKNFATAKDEKGWFHINKEGSPIYNDKYLAVEPFYNGYSLVTNFDNTKQIIDERGDKIIEI